MPTERAHQEAPASPLENETMRRVSIRLLPLIIVCYIVAYIDRSNVSIAALTMNDDIGLTATAYGVGAGLFFVTYIIFEIPSNLALARFGARRWIARIMITWGVIAAGMALVQGPASFNTVRLLLGAAEAGFTPGVIFYLALWFPSRHRGRAMAWFYVGAAMATVIGAPLGGAILELDGLASIAGWRWLFVIEAVPAVVLGFVVLKYFTDKPQDAHWLSADQRGWLTSTLAAERNALEKQRTFTVWGALTNPGILLLALFFFLYSFNSIGLTLWMPQVIQGTFGEPGDFATTLLTAVPYACAVVLMLAVARSMARWGRPHLHMSIPMAVAGVLLALSIPAGPTLLGFCLLAISTGFAWSSVPALWESATSYMTGVAAAAGVALVNSVANIAGFSVPPLIGRVHESTGTFALPLLIVAAAMAGAAGVALISRRYTAPGRLAQDVRASAAE